MKNSFELSDICYRRSKRAKYLRITVKDTNNIIVTIPKNVDRSNAKEFVLLKKRWIEKQIFNISKNIEFTKQNTKKIPFSTVKQAKTHLISRLSEIAEKNGFHYNRVFIKTQKTRWGSCSGKNNINLNLKLLTLPKKYQDYILLHELVHTKVKNHGNDFWEEMEKYFLNPKKIAKQLKKFNLESCRLW